MELDWETNSVGELTLVAARLSNRRATPRRVRLENSLDGPVLPPRRQGEPEAGWDRDGVTTVVPAKECVALGYACPNGEQEPTEPPVAVKAVESPDTAEAAGASGAAEATATEKRRVSEVKRRYADARPPRVAVGGPTALGSQERPLSLELSEREAAKRSDGEADSAVCLARNSRTVTKDMLRQYRSRIETVEALTVAGVTEAADLLETGGGLTGIEAMGRELTDDAAALRALAAEATALAARADAATPPTETLRRLS